MTSAACRLWWTSGHSAPSSQWIQRATLTLPPVPPLPSKCAASRSALVVPLSLATHPVEDESDGPLQAVCRRGVGCLGDRHPPLVRRAPPHRVGVSRFSATQANRLRCPPGGDRLPLSVASCCSASLRAAQPFSVPSSRTSVLRWPSPPPLQAGLGRNKSPRCSPAPGPH